MTRNTVTDRDVAQLAEEASVDRRSVTRALAGLPVRGLAGQRVARVLEAHGFARSTTNDTNPPPARVA